MDIVPKTVIEHRQEKKEKQRPVFKMGGAMRLNNKENTRGRHTQYIHYVDDTVFPPKMITKCLKHLRRF